MRELYPPCEPTSTWMLETDSPHRAYVEECGNRDGIPVVFLHGGPGSGFKPYHRQFFNPRRYRVVIFDQRGCARSTPQGETRDNTTQLLLQDMEAIRERLSIDRWVLFGGSWGAALALLYAQRYPQRVRAMILRGTFLARQKDVDWFFQRGVNAIFPDYWTEMLAAFKESEHSDLIEAAYQRMQSGDSGERAAVARAWTGWTGRVVTYLLPEGPTTDVTDEDRQRMLNEVTVETHYARHHYFLEENQILRDVSMLPDVPTTIIHGRRDLTCTLESSWTLHQALPKSKFVILRESGHLANDPAMIDALVTASDELAEKME